MESVIKCYGIHRGPESLTNNNISDHLVLEFASYGTLQSLALFTKPFEETAAFVIIR